MKKLIFTLLLSISTTSLAGDSAKNEKLNELLSILNMDSMIETMYSQMETMMQNMSEDMGVSAAEKPIIDKYFSEMTLIMKEEMNWEKMKPEVITIYERHFTTKEIEDMLTFYRTDTGKSLITKLPVVMQESMQMSQQFAQNILPQIQEINLELQKELEESRRNE